MLTELNAPTKTISLKTGDEIIGLYEKLQKDGNKINLVLELADRSIVQIPFLKGSVEAEIIRKALFPLVSLLERQRKMRKKSLGFIRLLK